MVAKALGALFDGSGAAHQARHCFCVFARRLTTVRGTRAGFSPDWGRLNWEYRSLLGFSCCLADVNELNVVRQSLVRESVLAGAWWLRLLRGMLLHIARPHFGPLEFVCQRQRLLKINKVRNRVLKLGIV